MSRVLRRVPLDFDWPYDQTWEGYVFPEELNLPNCHACDGTGFAPEALKIERTFYPHMIAGPRAEELAWHDKLTQGEVDFLVSKDRLWDFWRHVGPDGWEDNDPPTPPTAEEINAAQHNRRGFMGHDAINRMYLVEFRCQRLGVEYLCPFCDGHGDVGTPEQRAAADAWEPTDPPEGEGYQLWQDVSEGSPVSPVFETLDALCEYAAVNCTTFAWHRASAAEWKEMLDDGFVFHKEGNQVFI